MDKTRMNHSATTATVAASDAATTVNPVAASMSTGQRIAASLRFLLASHGWPAALGILLMAAALLIQWLGIMEEQSQIQDYQARKALLRQTVATRPGQQDTVTDTTHLHAMLPTTAQSAAAIDLIHAAARVDGVELLQGEYRIQQADKTSFIRYQITLPVKTGYPQLRTWLADIMNKLPALALDEISFKRNSISSDTVEARLQFTLFLKAE